MHLVATRPPDLRQRKPPNERRSPGLIRHLCIGRNLHLFTSLLTLDMLPSRRHLRAASVGRAFKRQRHNASSWELDPESPGGLNRLATPYSVKPCRSTASQKPRNGIKHPKPPTLNPHAKPSYPKPSSVRLEVPRTQQAANIQTLMSLATHPPLLHEVKSSL